MPSDAIITSFIAIIPSLLTLLLVYRQGTKLETIHTLTNSSMGIQLKLNANNARWRADSSKKPEDIEAADQAESLLREHEIKQAQVDNKTPNPMENL